MIVKTGDKHPVVWRANMDLTGAVVRLIASPRAGVPIVLPCTVTDAPEGVVSHMLTGALAKGDYRIELEVTIGGVGGEIITFPNSGYAKLTVIPDLD